MHKKFAIIIFLALLAFSALPALADDIQFKPQVTIPDSRFDKPATVSDNTVAEYIKAIYIYGVGIVGILAVVVMMFGGILMITSGGNQEQVAKAKSYIGASVSGLVLALASVSILYYINPDLTSFRPIKIEKVEGMPKTSYAGLGPRTNSVCDWSQTDTCPDRWNKMDDSYCGGENEKICCCPPYGGSWSYQTSLIQNQLPDASPQLLELMNCLRINLPEGAGDVSSISDSMGFDQCVNHYDETDCAHSRTSCHYGAGGIYDSSHAIDLGDEWNDKLFYDAYKRCFEQGLAGVYLNEGNHIHISTKACRNH